MGIDPFSLALLAGGALLGSQMNKQQQPQQQAPTPPPEPQTAKIPDAGAARTQNMGMAQAGGAPGAAQTLLTGASGIDPKLLKLGKNTLLGG